MVNIDIYNFILTWTLILLFFYHEFLHVQVHFAFFDWSETEASLSTTGRYVREDYLYSKLGPRRN